MSFTYPMPTEVQEANKRLHDAICEMLVERQIAIENLTRQQLADAIQQAILCGDFQKHVRVGDNAQCIIYIPYREAEQLQSKIKRLKEIIETAGIELEPDPL